MNPKPQTLTSTSAALLLAVFAVALVIGSLNPVLLSAQTETAKSADEAAAAPQADKAPQLTPSDQSAAQVFDGIAGKLDEAESFTCTLQQTITLSGQRFLAAGTFVHASGNRMRLQYRLFPVRAVRASDKEQLSVSGKPEDTSELKESGALTQVSDGSVLWSYWVNEGAKQLTRRNLQEIIDAVGKIPNETNLRSLQSLGVGGLKTLMSQLQVGMEFGGVQEQMAGNTKLLVLSGRWSEQTRRDVLRLPDDAAAPLPPYLPDYVRIYVDAGTMLPRRIQYLRKHPNPELKQVRPLVTLDFRSIRLNAELPDGVFEFKRPEDTELVEIDLTAQIIENIKKLAAGNTAPDNGQPPTP